MEKKTEIGFFTMITEISDSNEAIPIEYSNDCGSLSMKIELHKVPENLWTE